MNQVKGLIPAQHGSTIVLLIALLLPALTTPTAADEVLPSLGENALINLEQERKIGQKFYDRLLDRGLVETDPLLDYYINELGARLLSGLEGRVRNYRFFIVKDKGVNAFAVPGGFIGVNIGLINATQDQHQLASVLAHEIAHVQLMHSLALMQKSKGVSEATMLSMLAGILLSGIDSDLGAAVIYGSAAGSQQSMINFTRENEYEADRLGIKLLQDAEFDGRGAVQFFSRMEQLAGRSDFQSIEYLRTHPVYANRISEVQSRVRSDYRGRPIMEDFPLFKDYLFYVVSDQLEQSNSEFRNALAQIKNGQFEAANLTLTELHQKNGDNIWYACALAENLQNLKLGAQAEQVYRQLLQIYPDNFVVSMRLIRLLRSTSQYPPALTIARRLENQYAEDKTVYFELAEIYRALGRISQALFAEAEYHRLSGNRKRAVQLYDVILADPATDLGTESKVREKKALLAL